MQVTRPPFRACVSSGDLVRCAPATHWHSLTQEFIGGMRARLDAQEAKPVPNGQRKTVLGAMSQGSYQEGLRCGSGKYRWTARADAVLRLLYSRLFFVDGG